MDARTVTARKLPSHAGGTRATVDKVNSVQAMTDGKSGAVPIPESREPAPSNGEALAYQAGLKAGKLRDLKGDDVEWRPIDGVPKDGRVVMLRDESGVHRCAMRWNKHEKRWEGRSYAALGSSRTTWDEDFCRIHEWAESACCESVPAHADLL